MVSGHHLTVKIGFPNSGRVFIGLDGSLYFVSYSALKHTHSSNIKTEIKLQVISFQFIGRDSFFSDCFNLYYWFSHLPLDFHVVESSNPRGRVIQLKRGRVILWSSDPEFLPLLTCRPGPFVFLFRVIFVLDVPQTCHL